MALPLRVRVVTRRLAAPLVVGGAVAALAATGVSAVWELPLRDLVLRALPSHAVRHVAAVVVDEAAVAEAGPWPWPRARLADLVRRTASAGASVVVVDVLLAEPGGDDGALAAALSTGPAILVAVLDDSGRRWILPAPALRAAATIAHASFVLDHDGVLRRLVTTQQAGGLSLPAVSVAAASAAGWGPVPVGRTLVPGSRFRPQDVPVVGAAALLAGRADPSALRGRIVFLGAAAAGLGDRVVTPTSGGGRPAPGVLVQAATTESILSGDLLVDTPPWLAALAAALLAMLVVSLPRAGGWRRLAGAAALVTGPPLAGIAALALVGVDAHFATLTAVSTLGVLAVEARTAWLAFTRTGVAAGLLAPADMPSEGLPRSPEHRLRRLEELARGASLRRDEDADARRVLAHELKTPLTSMRGLTQLLAEFDLAPDESRRVARMASEETERMRELVDRLLAVERLATRDFATTTSRVDLTDLVTARCRGLGAATGRSLVVDAPAPAPVLGDASLLGRVIDNLLGNAIKYSPPDTVVRARVRVAGAEAVLEVADRGPGIPLAEQHAIFDRFRRGSTSAATDGLGLGLAVVAEVVTWHRGRVELDSRPGEGSTFRVIVPAAPAPPAGG